MKFLEWFARYSGSVGQRQWSKAGFRKVGRGKFGSWKTASCRVTEDNQGSGLPTRLVKSRKWLSLSSALQPCGIRGWGYKAMRKNRICNAAWKVCQKKDPGNRFRHVTACMEKMTPADFETATNLSQEAWKLGSFDDLPTRQGRLAVRGFRPAAGPKLAGL